MTRTVMTGALLFTALACSLLARPSSETTLPIVVSGQSNAVNLMTSEAMSRLYKSGVTCGGCESNMPITSWGRNTPLWVQLRDAVARPLRAFVWWQGEAEAREDMPLYYDRLVELMSRVRFENGNPHLLIVIVQNVPNRNDVIRDAERRFVAGDPDSRLVDVDDLKVPNDNHVHWPDGYVTASKRVMAAINAARP